MKVIKEMCGLRGAARTDFASSVSSFAQQITHLSKLVGKTPDVLSATALTAHLLDATAPENLCDGGIQVKVVNIVWHMQEGIYNYDRFCLSVSLLISS